MRTRLGESLAPDQDQPHHQSNVAATAQPSSMFFGTLSGSLTHSVSHEASLTIPTNTAVTQAAKLYRSTVLKLLYEAVDDVTVVQRTDVDHGLRRIEQELGNPEIYS